VIDNNIWTTPAGSLGLGVLDARPHGFAMPAIVLSLVTPTAPLPGTSVPTGGDLGATSPDRGSLRHRGVGTPVDDVPAIASSRLRGLPAAAGTTGSFTTGVATPADAIQFEKTPSGPQPPRPRLS